MNNKANQILNSKFIVNSENLKKFFLCINKNII